jgi:hypothetical protein
MNVQTPLPNTKPATAVVSQLKQQSALQALVASNPFFDTTWLALEEINQQGSSTEAPQYGTRLTYLPNLQAALESHMHSNHRLGYANSKTGY